MDISPELKAQLERLHYWSKAVEHVPPKRVVKKPSDVPAEELTDFDFKKHTFQIDTQ
jgi:hypothetical protein